MHQLARAHHLGTQLATGMKGLKVFGAKVALLHQGNREGIA
jgi:hypothetical protein